MSSSEDDLTLVGLPADLLREIVSFLGTEWALPLALTSKALLAVVREQSGEVLKTRPACFLQSVSLCEYGRDVMGLDMTSRKVMNEAARYGLLEGVKWLRGGKAHWDHTTLIAAAKGGHLAVMQWIKNCDPSVPWVSGSYYGVCARAARNGHLHVIQWARSQDPPAPWDAWTCREAADNGHLHVIQWARAQRPPSPWDEYMCRRAAQRGYREIVEWAIAQDPPCPMDVWTRKWVDNGYHLGKVTLEDM